MHLPNVALVVPLALVACGGRSTPTSPARPDSTVLDLAPGTYALAVTLSETGDPVCHDGFCASFSACVSTVGVPSVSTARTAVRLDRSESAITIRPEDPSATLRIDLQMEADTMTGTASGEFRSGTVVVFVGAQGTQTQAVVTGAIRGASVRGKIDGQVSIGGYSCSNNGHSWTLTR